MNQKFIQLIQLRQAMSEKVAAMNSDEKLEMMLNLYFRHIDEQERSANSNKVIEAKNNLFMAVLMDVFGMDEAIQAIKLAQEIKTELDVVLKELEVTQ